MDWKHFRHIKKGNPYNFTQLIFFKVHSSSWFSTREFLAIYSTSITKTGGYNSHDEAIIEKNAIKTLEEQKSKPIRRYYGQVAWSTIHIPVLEQVTLQQLLHSVKGLEELPPDNVVVDDDENFFSLHLDHHDEQEDVASLPRVVTQLPTPPTS